MHVLVTGGCGFIGSHLVKALIAQNHHVTVIDDLSTGQKSRLPSEVQFIHGDVTDALLFMPVLATVDCCYHLAAITSVEEAGRQWYRAYQVNAGGIVNLFQAIALSGRTIPVVYASSAAVYGNSQHFPLSEDVVVIPLTAYGAAKLACEQQASIAANLHTISTIGLRFFNVYGPREKMDISHPGVVSIFHRRIIDTQPVIIYGDGGHSRDFIYIGDAVQALLCAMRQLQAKRLAYGIFNICTGKAVTILTLAEKMAALAGRDMSIAYLPPSPGDIRLSVGDPHNAARTLGYQASVMLDEGLEKIIHAQQD